MVATAIRLSRLVAVPMRWVGIPADRPASGVSLSPSKVTEVVLRDAHQSLLATRMTMDEMRPILPEMDKINYFSVECWGCLLYTSRCV